jgi:hypothetical protein
MLNVLWAVRVFRGGVASRSVQRVWGAHKVFGSYLGGLCIAAE